VIPNISEVTELLNYISIYSDAPNQEKAALGSKVMVKFSSIIALSPAPEVTILGRAASVAHEGSNKYVASVIVDEDDVDGQVFFNIHIPNQGYALSRDFDSTTNGSFVIIDQEPITAVVGTDTADDGNYLFEGYVQFSEPVASFDLSDFIVDNCKLSNLYKVTSLNKYTFTVQAIASGELSYQLPGSSVQDLAGNANTASNVFSRTVTVPVALPDPYWDYVLSLIQPNGNIIEDESDYAHEVISTNVVVVNEGPPGLNKSMRFDGTSSSLNFTLPSDLSESVDYTIELWMYSSSSTLLRLSRPGVLPASDVTTNSFKANWQTVPGATSYLVDVSPTSNFTSYLPGYKGYNAGDSSNLPVSSDVLDVSPRAKAPRFVGNTSFVAEWSRLSLQGYEILGYKYDVSLNSTFTKVLYGYQGKFTTSNYFAIGEDYSRVTAPPQPGSSNSNSFEFNESNGVLLTGLFSTSSFPKLYYFLEESTVRFYDKQGYTDPIIAENIETLRWQHVAMVNQGKYLKLYVDGELVDKVRKVSFDTDITVGYDVGHFRGNITGIRVTKGVARYTGDTIPVPTLPYSTN
jgi:hypothetical protein